MHVRPQRLLPRQRRAFVSRRDPSAFTLLELLIALTIMSVIIGITLPAVGRYLGEQVIKNNVEQVRATLAGVRHRSLSSGLVYQFRYEPGGQRYIVLPFDTVTPADNSGTGGNTSVESAAAASSPTLQVVNGLIDERCHFAAQADAQHMFAASNVVASANTEQLPEDLLKLFSNGAELAQVQWSLPLLFYPEGTADDGAFTLLDQQSRSITISVRGLTSAVAVGKMAQGGRE